MNRNLITLNSTLCFVTFTRGWKHYILQDICGTHSSWKILKRKKKVEKELTISTKYKKTNDKAIDYLKFVCERARKCIEQGKAVTSQPRPLPHPGLDSILARYCPFWAYHSLTVFIFGNLHENFPVGHPSWDCSSTTRLTSEFLRNLKPVSYQKNSC